MEKASKISLVALSLVLTASSRTPESIKAQSKNLTVMRVPPRPLIGQTFLFGHERIVAQPSTTSIWGYFKIGGGSPGTPRVGLRTVDPRLDNLSALETKESIPRERIS